MHGPAEWRIVAPQMKRILHPTPEIVAGNLKPTTPDIVDKAAYAARYGGSRRWVDGLLAQGLPHLKIGARRVRIVITEADGWMREKFHVQRMGGAQ